MDNLAADFEINPNNPLNAEYELGEGVGFDCSFELYASGTVWGSIDGDINNQTDLINLLNTKVDLTSFEELSQTVTNNYNELTGDIADLTTTVTDNYNTLSGQISDLTGVVNDNYTSLDNRLTTAEGSILNLTDTVNNNYTELNGKITATNNNLSTLSQTVENNNTAINNRVDGIVDSFDGDISDLNNAIDNLSDTVSDNYTELNGKITVNTDNITTIQNTINSYGDIVSYNAAYFATANQGTLADTALQPNDNISELVNDVGYITSASLPTVNNATITIQKNGSSVGTFTLNQANNDTLNITVPTQASDIGAMPDTTTIADLTTTAQLNALNSGATSVKINQIATNTSNIASINNTISGFGNIVTHNVSEFATSAQGLLANTALQPNDNISELTNDVGYITSASLPTVNNGTLDIQVNGTSIGTFTANQSGNTTANIVVPDSVTWGNITGTLSNQIDLQNALNSKYDASNPAGYITTSDLPTNYVTTDTVQDISGRKTFLGEKAIYFKQNIATDKLGFTLYNTSNAEVGGLEYRPNTINGNALLALNCPQSGSNYVGFRYWSNINIVAPRPTTDGIYYIPVNVTDGTNTVTANNNGTLNISSLLPDVSDMATQTWVTNQGYTTNVGTVTSVNNIQPDASGNVTLTIPDTATWGNITGTLSNQTDLQDALDEKQDKLTAGENITIEEQQEGWTPAVQDGNLGVKDWSFVAYGNNKFVAIGYGSYVSTSTDGTTWTSAVKDSNLGENDWVGVAYGNNKFVAIDVRGYVSTSTDGTTWTSAVQDSNLGENDWSVVAYDGTKFVALAHSGYVSTSTDGTTWAQATKVSNLGNHYWQALTYDGTKFVALGAEGYVSTSTDGTTWTSAVKDGNLGENDWSVVAYGNNKFVAIGYDGYVSTSVDGTTWTSAVQDSNLGSRNWNAIAYDGTKFVALGEGGCVSQYFAEGTIISATVPTVNNGTLTIQKNGTTVGTFTANDTNNITANISVPTSISNLTDDTSTYPIDKAESVVDNNSGSLKFWSGTKAQYDAITTKDANTLYNIESIGLYKGTQLISGAIPDMANQSLSNLNSAGQDKFDAKVNKSGDTMTGDLRIRKSYPVFKAESTDIRRGQTPSADYYSDTFMLTDIDGNGMGSLSQIYFASGKHTTRLWQRGANSDVYSVLDVGMNENDVPYCTFPNTTCCDGQWVGLYQEAIGGTAQTINAQANKVITFTALPAKKCEIMFTITQTTDIELAVWSSLLPNGGSNRALKKGCATIMLPVDSDKIVKIGNLNHTTTASINLVRLIGYRIIGTNINN